MHRMRRALTETIGLPALVIGAVILALGAGIASAVLPWFIVLGGIAGAVLSVFIFNKPYAGIVLIAFFLPFERLGAYEMGDTTIRMSQVLLLITAAAWLWRVVSTRQFRFARNPALIPLAVLFGLALLSLPNALNLERSLTVFSFIVFTALLILLVPNLIRTKEQFKKVVTSLLISFVLVSSFGVFQFLADMSGAPTEVTGLRELYTRDILGFTRVQSTAYEPLYFANYLLLPIAILFAFFLSGRNAIKASWLVALFGLGMVNLILTVSRGAYLAIPIVLAFIALWYLRNVFTLQNVIMFLVGVVIVGWVVIQTLGVGGELFTIEKFTGHIRNACYGASFDERITTFEQAVSAWHDYPLLGVGVGGFGPYVAPHPYYVPEDGWRIVNNELIEILAEQGILGLFAFLAFAAVLIIRSFIAIRRAKDSYLRALMVALAAAFLGVLVQYQTFSTLYIVHVWFLIGAMVACQNILLHRAALPVPRSDRPTAITKKRRERVDKSVPVGRVDKNYPKHYE